MAFLSKTYLKTVLENVRNYVIGQLAGKVDKVDGKGLSTNDFTTAEKEKLAGIDTSIYMTRADMEAYINETFLGGEW